MKTITSTEIKKYESRYRARLINSLSGAKSANLIGTKSLSNQENLCVVSSCFHLGADPALMGVIFRPAVVERHTFENIMETKYFSINHINSSIVKQAHQTSARYPREVSEFNATELNPEYIDEFNAPFVRESLLQIGLELRESQHLSINKTELVIGEIKFVRVPEDFIQPDGFIDLFAANSQAVTGLDCYHSLNQGERLSYAKPDQPAHVLNLDGTIQKK